VNHPVHIVIQRYYDNNNNNDRCCLWTVLRHRRCNYEYNYYYHRNTYSNSTKSHRNGSHNLTHTLYIVTCRKTHIFTPFLLNEHRDVSDKKYRQANTARAQLRSRVCNMFREDKSGRYL